MSSSSNITPFACRPPLGDNVRPPAVRLQRYSEIHPTAGIAVSNMRCRASVDVPLQQHYTVRLPAALGDNVRLPGPFACNITQRSTPLPASLS